MGSITTWMRLEPQTRTADLSRPLQARIHDPLWLLARQWQSGELHGEDAGTPIQARVNLQWSGPKAYHPGPVGAGAADANRVFPYADWYAKQPLEAMVEGEPVRRPHRPDFRQAAEAGLQFCRLLAKHSVSEVAGLYQAQFKLAMPSEPDAATRRFLAVVGKRAPDGGKLYADSVAYVRPGEGKAPALPPQPAVPAGQQAGALAALLEFVAWYEGLFAEPSKGLPSAWNPERQEYEFAVGGRLAGKEVVLTADGYADGHLDWYAFDRHATASLGLTGGPEQYPIDKTMVPVPVTFKGMPADRWWTFEDSRVHFGGIEASKRDLGRLMLGQFATLYGNDWFVIPVKVTAGALAMVKTLTVTDTFGIAETIEPYTKLEPAGSTWRIFHLSERVPVPAEAKLEAPLLFLPPTLASSLQSRPVEEVLFLRDEGANMAWAVERVVEGLLGQPVQRAEEVSTPAQGSLAASASGGMRYRLATGVPDHWTPLLPERLRDKRSIRLLRGRLLRALDGELAPPPKGELLAPSQPLALFEEEVPRAGSRVIRQYQYARWYGGSSHLWIGRQKGAGRGEGASGLRYDLVE